MALNNIISPRQSVVNSQGQPVAGGFVYLYEPGTTTFITSYFTSDLVTPHQNPVRLSGSGRADIWVTLNCDMVITDRNGNTVLTQDSVNPDSLGGSNESLVPNGSFETVTTPPVPDGWTAVDDAGSTNAVDSTQSTDGANSYRFTSAGSGGGSLTTTDFFPVNDVDQLRVNFDMFSDVAAVLNIVRVEWYDVTFVSISDTDVYSSTSNPLSWTEFQLVATPPALARFAKIKLIGIDPSVLLAGNTYFDRISVFYPTVVSGIFDNITIQNNEIISTNLNGEINLLPNGAGPVQITSSGVVDLTDIQNSLNIGNIAGPALNPHLAFDAATIQAKASAAVSALALSIQPLGGIVSLGAAGVTRAATAPSGIFGVLSDGNTDAESRLVVLTHQDGTARAQLGHPATDTLEVRNLIDAGFVQLIGNDPGSVARIVFQGDPDGAGSLYYVGVEVVRTENASNGGLEVNNTLTGGGFERVLTTGDASVLLPAGTVDNAMLRYDTGNVAWEEVTAGTRLTSTGELQVTNVRALNATSIQILGLDEADDGLIFRDGSRISFEDRVSSASLVHLWNDGIGTNTIMMAAPASSFSFRLLNGSFQLRNAGNTAGATFSFLDTTQDQVILSGPPVFNCNPAIRLLQKTLASNDPDAVALSVAIFPADVVDDRDLNLYTRAGAFPVDDRILAHLNPKRIANINLDLATAEGAQRALNATFFYDDGLAHNIDLEPNTQTRFINQSTFTIINAGAGTITVNEGTGDTLYFVDPGTGRTDTLGGCTIGPGGTATVYRDSDAIWYILGSEITP